MNGRGGEQTTFDLEAAHLYAETSPLISHKPYLAALDEIERQNASLDEAEKLIRKNAETMNAQAKRIAELQEFCDELMGNCNGLRGRSWRLEERNIKQRAALKKLGQVKRERGKALVEERARRICHVPGDPVGHWERYEKVVVDEAREQLVHEGKL